jgi:co-chaperonin GroES (HSP10)
MLDVIEREDTALGQQLYHRNSVLVRYADLPAGEGKMPSGLYVMNSKGLPAIFAHVLAVGPGASERGIKVGQFVLFVRYAGEVTDVYYDGTTYAIFDAHDLLSHYPERLAS